MSLPPPFIDSDFRPSRIPPPKKRVLKKSRSEYKENQSNRSSSIGKHMVKSPENRKSMSEFANRDARSKSQPSSKIRKPQHQTPKDSAPKRDRRATYSFPLAGDSVDPFSPLKEIPRTPSKVSLFPHLEVGKKLDFDDESLDGISNNHIVQEIRVDEEEIEETQEPIQVIQPVQVVQPTPALEAEKEPISTQDIVIERKMERKLTIPFDEVFIAKKYGRRGKPHQRQLWITKEAIHWKDIKQKSSRFILLRDITAIQKGCNTKVFGRYKNLDNQCDQCFSLIAKKRTLDLQFKQQEDRNRYYQILQSLMSL
eukprot:TRINITY_DN3149_c0_g1_i1.p1 TRINITY_DN3149_c0_g1~~TRINITY_DN3149_c0_g1_i1.p1  ORF type:complete len:311 (-),score=77.89 TRINITY_DN3149_c0_g1_i1:42-974(-)